MAAFKTILLCYDSTREGRRALLQGAELAQQLGAETHLLAIAPTIVGSSMMDMPSAVALQEAERNIRDVLREGVERLRARGLVATGHLAFGRPTEQIPAVARDLGVDLIIIGHRPCGVVERWWAGPGNAQLLDHIACSILVSIDPNETTTP
ncbi:MAG TPA: universal stress protein [Xanthobacteraceae bacterium]|nr:universal stress protein [Xanthobacteraceae bacterium]